MRVKGDIVQKFLLGTALMGALAWNLAQAGELSAIDVSNDSAGTRAEITLSDTGEYRLIKLTGPNRLVVDIDDAEVKKELKFTPAGWITNVRTGVQDSGAARVVFDLEGTANRVRSRIENVNGVRKLILTFPGQGVAAAPAPNPTPVVTQPAPVVAAATLAPTPRDNELNSLISDLRQGTAMVPPAPATVTAQVPTSQPSAVVMPAAAQDIPKVMPREATPVTIATGVPTRRATGVPTALTPKGAAALQQGTVSSVTPPVRVATPAPTPVVVNNPPPRYTAPPVMGVQSVRELRNERLQRGQRELVIAIDPGHGGQDSGAIGLNGTREKDVVLQIARELARQVNATPGMRAVLTRNSDYFIPLPDRPKIARKAGADIFISVHADAVENNRSAGGSSVYVLSTKGASSQRARWLADKENAADLIGGVKLERATNSLASVLIDLTQSGHMKASEDAASVVLEGLKGTGNRIHKRSIERANFAVLRGSDMPSMLVETAFISNPDEERKLQDPSYQSRLAGAILDGVHTYFSRQAPPGTIYASLGDGETNANVSGGSP